VSGGTIFALAEQHGYTRPAKASKERPKAQHLNGSADQPPHSVALGSEKDFVAVANISGVMIAYAAPGKNASAARKVVRQGVGRGNRQTGHRIGRPLPPFRSDKHPR
jgi:hypothetical protein